MVKGLWLGHLRSDETLVGTLHLTLVRIGVYFVSGGCYERE